MPNYDIEKSALNEMFKQYKSSMESAMNTEVQIYWQEATQTYDDVNNIWVTGTPQDKNITLICIDKEEKTASNVASSGIIEGVVTGKHRVYLRYEDKFLPNSITGLVTNSLKFIIRPNSEMPKTLIPKMELTEISYFLELQDYPINQMWILNVGTE